MDNIYSIKDLAQACDTTPRAVRLYVQKNLLQPQRAGRTYVFTHTAVTQLNVILRCKRIGLSLDEIKRHLNARSATEVQIQIARIQAIANDAQIELQALQARKNVPHSPQRS